MSGLLLLVNLISPTQPMKKRMTVEVGIYAWLGWSSL